MRRHRPRCRVCGTPVQFMGDYCPSCEPAADEAAGIVAITQADLARLAERASDDPEVGA